jgi:hypothetical protein
MGTRETGPERQVTQAYCGMSKSPRVIFKPNVAENEWQIGAHHPGAEIRYITGFTSKADIDDWMQGSAASIG